ncbi:ABC transporter ATP-binding protein [Neorhizobium lilium]|uniref:ABC transporter ATP-binding protein n=1 Tax=Neorhizobium lilium TaxID=2503024 RepID=A0A444LLS3_9HYPH|nr:ABC transporter ATP-binding protein [Neorhizobium lilium]RWX81296.1 ABC transporter ATP-binding protein [Neorhizobium lilium]
MTLVFDNLRKQYGNNVAIDAVSTRFEPGLIHGIIGPNGAGKSTLINMTAGSYTVSAGSISLDDRKLSGLKKYQIANAGIARTYQNIRLFDQMTVLENLEVCFYPQEVGQTWKEVIWPPFAKKREARRQDACMELLSFFNLQGYAHAYAGSLPYGRQRMLEIARALVTNPKVLLLDEPAAGLNHHETAELTAKLSELKSQNRVMIIVEHDMDLVMALCDRIVVMHHGKLLFQGTPGEVQASSDVQLAYLGTANDIDDIKAAAQDRRAQLGIRTRQRS